MSVRSASHAGSWYDGRKDALVKKLMVWSEGTKTVAKAKYIVAPHAGYLYSGATASSAFASLPETVSRVFVIGPDHIGVSTHGIAHLTPYAQYETPLGALTIDVDAVQRLSKKQGFVMGDPREDLEEHSLEMMMPFVAFRTGLKAKVVPMVITGGSLPAMQAIADALKAEMGPDDFLVVSSDFCHYGRRFGFELPTTSNLDAAIEALDRRAVDAMNLGAKELEQYFHSTHNTICGHFPIVLATLLYPPPAYASQVVMYSRSSPDAAKSDSSVSYCAVVTCEK